MMKFPFNHYSDALIENFAYDLIPSINHKNFFSSTPVAFSFIILY